MPTAALGIRICKGWAILKKEEGRRDA
jgi:hypothetical protein